MTPFGAAHRGLAQGTMVAPYLGSMSRSLEVRDLRPDEYPDWTRLVEGSPAGSVYALPEYLEVLSRVTGGLFSIRAAFKGEGITGGIPFFRQGSGTRVEAVPRLLLFYNGPVLRRYTTRYPAEIVKRHLATLQVLERSIRDEGLGKVVLRARSPLTDVRAFRMEGGRPGRDTPWSPPWATRTGCGSAWTRTPGGSWTGPPNRDSR